jgi:fluoride exporter
MQAVAPAAARCGKLAATAMEPVRRSRPIAAASPRRSPHPPLDRRAAAAIFVGGLLGALARGALAHTWTPAAGTWPWVTFAVNLAGAFLLGAIVTRSQLRAAHGAHGRPLVGTAFCGAFTTFSTMQVELLRMLDRDALGLALGYSAASVAGGLLAVRVATAIVRRAHPAP